MRRAARVFFILLLTAVAVPTVFARQVAEPARREPPPRTIEVPSTKTETPTQDARQNQELPKIELPEYVITGIESIDLPDVEKSTPAESGILAPGTDAGPGRREALATAPRVSTDRPGQTLELPDTRARIAASIGTFASPRAQAWFGQRYADFDYGLSADYHKTGGYAPNTGRSGGSAALDGGYLVRAENPYFDAARVSGLLGFASETYKLYGSIQPTSARTNDGVNFAAGFASSVKSPWQYRAGVGLSTFAVKESSLSARQNLAEFSAASDIPTPIVPLAADVRISLATRTALVDENTSMVKLGVESERAWWDSFYAQAGLALYVAKGMAGQNLTRLYPTAAVGYHFPSVHTATLAYQPQVRFSTLDGLVGANPYLSSSATIRHINVPLRFAGVLESEWSDAIVTRLAVRWEQWKDEPLYADTAGTGLWTLEYAGTTTRLEAELEAFANLSANDYVAVSIVGRSSRIDETSVPVPYVPEAEGSASYRHRFALGIDLLARVSVFGRRNTQLDREDFLDGYAIAGLRAEYSPLEPLTVFVDLDNLLDVRYEVWKGYRAHPFLLTAGVSYTW